jgi:hypothetical protein
VHAGCVLPTSRPKPGVAISVASQEGPFVRFCPFQEQLGEHRSVQIPAGLSSEDRSRLVARIAAAVRQQSDLAEQHDALLRVSPQVRELADRVIIHHEPAAALDPRALDAGAPRPDLRTLQWLTAATLEGLGALGQANVVHGGIQPGALLLDRSGRPKLTDVGIAPAFEAVCGLELRRFLHCDLAAGNGSADPGATADWSLLSEDVPRPRGWIAPFFAHELLEGQVRLNAKSDQFSLGVLLYLLATGIHPYDGQLNDPTLLCYFLLEPYDWTDERRDWAPAFERRAKELVQPGDRPLLSWADLIRKLLSSDSTQRFRSAVEAEAAMAPTLPTSWKDATESIRRGFAALEAGDPDGFLERVAQWARSDELPELWRERLGPWVERVEAQRELIAKRVRLGKSLSQAREAFDRLEIARARELAVPVRDEPEAEERQQQAAVELLDLCDEFERIGRDTQTQWAEVYLQAARQSIDRRQLDEARSVLLALRSDPAATEITQTRARDLLTEVEVVEQRLSAQRAELATATQELRIGQYAAARERLATLRADPQLEAELVEPSRAAEADVVEQEARHAEYSQRLEHALSAWERADPAELAQALRAVPADFPHADVAEVRRDLDTRLAVLVATLAEHDAAEEALERQEAASALQRAQRAAQRADIPQRLRDALADLGRRAERMQGQYQELTRAADDAGRGLYGPAHERVTQLLTAAELPEAAATQARLLLADIEASQEQHRLNSERLDAGEAAWREGDPTVLGAALEAVPDALREADLRERRDELRERSAALRRCAALRAAAEEALRSGTPERAGDLARQAANEVPLPDIVRDALETLVARCDAQVQQQRRELLARWRETLEQATQAWNDARFDACEQSLQALPVAEADLPDDLRSGAAALRERARIGRRAAEQVERAAEELSRQSVDGVARMLAPLEAVGLPAVLTQRVESIRAQATALAARLTAARREALARRLDDAQTALRAGRLEEAEAGTTYVRDARDADDALRSRVAELTAELAPLRRVARVLAEADRRAQAGTPADLAAAGEALAKLPGSLPEWAARQLETIAGQIAERLAQQRTEAGQRAERGLQQAEAALAQGDPKAARVALEDAPPQVAADHGLEPRRAECVALAGRMEELLPRVAELESRLKGDGLGDLPRDAEALLQSGALPAVVTRRLEALRTEAARRITAHRADLDAELERVGAELLAPGSARRSARRVAARLEALRRDALLTDAHRKRIDELLRRVAALPRARRPLVPIAVSAGLVLLAGGGLIALLGGWRPFGQGSRATDPNHHETNGVVVNDANSLNANDDARERERAAHEAAERERERAAQAAAEREREGLEREAAERERAVQEAAERRLAQQGLMEAARARLQQQVDHARGRAGPDARAATIAVEPVLDGTGALVSVELEGRSEPLMEVVPWERLQDARVPEPWIARTYPEPTPLLTRAEIVAQTRASIARQLGLGTESVELLPDGDAYLARLAVPERRRPLEVTHLNLAAPAEQPDADLVARVVANFRLQRQALELIARPGRFALSPDYDARLAFTGDVLEQCTLRDVDVNTGTLRVAAPARLRDDPRPDVAFALSGRCAIAQGLIQVDDNGQAAFAEYLAALRTDRLAAAVDALAEALKPPPHVTLAAPAGPVGDVVSLALGCPEVRDVALRWDSGGLQYVYDLRAVRADIAGAVRRLLRESRTGERLKAAWAQVREHVKLSDDLGRGYFEESVLTDVRPVDAQTDTDFTAAVELQLGPPGRTAEDRITIRAAVTLGPSGLEWHTTDLDALAKAVAEEVRRLADSVNYRERRTDEALHAAAEKEKLPLGRSDITRAVREEMTAVAQSGRERVEFTWRWDPAGLRWGEPEVRRAEVSSRATPVLTLDQKLQQLAGRDALEPAEIVDALVAVSEAKLRRFGAGPEYTVAQELRQPGLGAPGRLGALSAMLRRTTTRDLGREAYPVVFVEYYVGEADVYAISWQALGGPQQVTIHEPHVWRVMGTEQLLSPNPEALREQYRREEAAARRGIRLLGPALGRDALRADESGSYGLLVAPDGPLWMTRWEQVRLQSLRIEGLDLRGARAPSQINSLLSILRADKDGKRPRAGIWCVPTLGAYWTGAAQPTLKLGVIEPGQPTRAVSFDVDRSSGRFRPTTIDYSQAPKRNVFAMSALFSEPGLGSAFWELSYESTPDGNVRFVGDGVRSFVLLPMK